MRRFLIDGTIFEHPLTGVAKATLGLYQGLLENNDDVDITICHRQPLQGEIPERIRTIQLPSANARTWRFITLPLHVHRGNYDVVHFPWNGGIPPNLPRRVLKILTLHDVLPLVIPDFFNPPSRRTRYVQAIQRNLRRANLVITDSEYSREQIQQEFEPRVAPVVVYPASPLPAGSVSATSVTGSEAYFLFCGGYDKRKGIELLLETFIALWREDNFRIPLWLAGVPQEYSVHFSKLLHEARELGAVKELGYVSDEELAQFYRGALALLYPSRYEGFGLPPLEAMSLGCPVVTYPLTSLPEVCGDAVLYLEPQHDESLKRCILELTHDKLLRKKLSQLGRRQSARFSWTQSAAIFSDAVDERRSALK